MMKRSFSSLSPRDDITQCLESFSMCPLDVIGASSDNSSSNLITYMDLDAFDKDYSSLQISTPNLKTIRSTEDSFRDSYRAYVDLFGPSKVASDILENSEVKEEILKILLKSSHSSLKSSLKNSKLHVDKKDRNYLLSLCPRGRQMSKLNLSLTNPCSGLCAEFQQNAGTAFRFLVEGLIGITDLQKVFSSQTLLNNVCALYSSIARLINFKASGYALMLTTAARDGGLRCDSIRLFSFMCHPRTSQKYDRQVLSRGWDDSRKSEQKKEEEHFIAIKNAKLHLDKLMMDCSVDSDSIDSARIEVKKLVDECPPQLQLVWDNLNMHPKHRFERIGDTNSDLQLNWMASLWIQERINVNHMQHRGEPLKSVDNLKISDYTPSAKELDYVFISLVFYFSFCLVKRHPNIFKSIAKLMEKSRPHQFSKVIVFLVFKLAYRLGALFITL